jgi:signal peptidase II
MPWETRLLPRADDPAAVAPPVAPPAAAPAELTGLASFKIYWWLSAVAVVIDQTAKALVRAKLQLYDSRTIIPGFVDLIHVHNEGVAFGLLNDAHVPMKGWLTTALAVLALVGIGFYARHVRPEERLARLGLSLILGGAIGNLADRLRQNYVIDFMDVYFRGWHFWAFNVADAAITVGVTLMILDLLGLGARDVSRAV